MKNDVHHKVVQARQLSALCKALNKFLEFIVIKSDQAQQQLEFRQTTNFKNVQSHQSELNH